MTMYIIDDICYAGTPSTNARVVEARPLQHGMLLILFSTGEKRLFDTTTLQGSAFKPLQNEHVFRNLSVQHGFISWADGSIDIAPEYLYAHSTRYDESDDYLMAG